jgi:UDP-2,3-diacylglucosamine hydrolase
MTTLFISDLHLDDTRPESSRLFEQFIQEEALQAEALYILGDLFEYWIGDDMQSDISRSVAKALSGLSDAGIPCYFMHGNRDFLLGSEYASQCGLTLLPESVVIDLYGTQTLLLHGDTLCTDDTAYQELRLKVRNKQWQSWFLSQTIDERIALMLQARDGSRNHQSNISIEIMDANQDAVCRTFAQHGVSSMIHGHTHRLAIHEHAEEQGAARRVVLGDWYQSGSLVRAGSDGLSLEQYPKIIS